MKLCQFILFLSLLAGRPLSAHAQVEEAAKTPAKQTKGKQTVLYGQASYYASKFQGRKTANGEIFDHKKMTAACNSLPLGTWIKVTNLRNGKTVQLKVNDRLHHKTRRLVDLTKAAAQKLGFVKQGLTRVKVEVIKQKPTKK
ncbi:MAG: septal ring lytic transglycosylase RlpA family protein [Ferruginibacter sp.]